MQLRTYIVKKFSFFHTLLCLFVFLSFSLLFFQTDQTELKLADIKAEAIKQLSASCQCTLTFPPFSEESFVCFEDSPVHVTYRVRLTGTQIVSTASLLSILEAWVSSEAGIRVRSVLMRVDTQCSVAISSLIEEECSTPKPLTTMATLVTLVTEGNTSSQDPSNITVPTDGTVDTASDRVQSDNTAAIVGGVVAVILIVAVLIGIIAIVALVLRARRGSMSIKTPEE